jgi:hypothetical protein
VSSSAANRLSPRLTSCGGSTGVGISPPASRCSIVAGSQHRALGGWLVGQLSRAFIALCVRVYVVSHVRVHVDPHMLFMSALGQVRVGLQNRRHYQRLQARVLVRRQPLERPVNRTRQVERGPNTAASPAMVH